MTWLEGSYCEGARELINNNLRHYERGDGNRYRSSTTKNLWLNYRMYEDRIRCAPDVRPSDRFDASMHHLSLWCRDMIRRELLRRGERVG